MPLTPPPETISLRIKVPPGHLGSNTQDSFDLGNVAVNTTVASLRQQIQNAIPTNPSPDRQRLLYGGRALVDNDQSLADALNTKRDTTMRDYVVHLLVKGEGMNTAPTAGAGASSTARNTNTPPAATQQEQPAQQPTQPQGQQQAPNGQPGYHVQGVGPNGQRFEIHHQTFNIPNTQQGQMPPGGMPFGMPGMPPQMPGMNNLPPGIPHPPPFPMPPGAHAPPMAARQPGAPSALDRARQNIAETRRMLDEMRNQQDPASDEQQRRIADLQHRTTALQEYIDPFNLQSRNNAISSGAAGSGSDANAAGLGRRSAPPMPPRPAQFIPPMMPRPIQNLSFLPTMPQQPPTTNPNEVTAFLLSGPQGPHAILFSPEHGTFHGSFPRTTGLRPTATVRSNQEPWQNNGMNNLPTQQNQRHQQPDAQGAVPDPVAQAAAQQIAGAAADRAARGNAGVQAQAQDPLGPLQPLLAHFWLLLRILIFAYFLLGANMGYTRPMALVGIGLAFWAIRQGVLGDGAAVRRWWEGLVGVPEGQRDGAAQPGQDQQRQGQQDQQNGGHGGNAAVANNAANQGARQQMPTPEQVAQRLLDEQNQRRTWLREQLRPVERALALFVASLWPGIGEAHVRAREQEQRRLAEEEVARRRAEEEERARVESEEREKEKGPATESGMTDGEKKGEAGASSDVAAEGISTEKTGEGGPS